MSIVIRTEHLCKEYRLGVINHGMLYKDFQSWISKKLGRPDPHATIGNEQYTRRADRFWALRDVSFEVEQGDRVGIIGRNGAGKSTLLKILSRITAPTEGVVRLRGRVASLLEVGTGFHPELTGRENIYLNGAILGMKKRHIDKKMDEIIAFSEIETFIDTPVKRYSSGMYVRLAFSVAAHLDCEILLADEVLAVGDAAFQKKSIEKMKDLSQDTGRTILFVSHQMQYVLSLCNKGILLSKGAIDMSGRIDKVAEKYQNYNNAGMRHFWEYKQSDLPFSNIAIPRSLSISDSSGVAVETVTDHDNYVIHVAAEIVKPDPRIGMALAFYDDSDSLLFVSELYDSFPAERLRTLNGLVEFDVPMPKGIFLTLRYSVELLVYLHYTGWILEPRNKSRIHFNHFLTSHENWYAGDSRIGKLMIPMKWSLKNTKSPR